MPVGFHILDLFFLVGGPLWIAMLIDCLFFNTRLSRSQKIPWILALALVAPIGALLYFFIAFLGRFLSPNKTQTTQAQENHSKNAQTPYSEYAQGYQQTYQPAQQSQPPYQSILEDESVQQSSSYPFSEQPQASYPEQTQRPQQYLKPVSSLRMHHF